MFYFPWKFQNIFLPYIIKCCNDVPWAQLIISIACEAILCFRRILHYPSFLWRVVYAWLRVPLELVIKGGWASRHSSHWFALNGLLSVEFLSSLPPLSAVPQWDAGVLSMEDTVGVGVLFIADCAGSHSPFLVFSTDPTQVSSGECMGLFLIIFWLSHASQEMNTLWTNLFQIYLWSLLSVT